VDLTSESKDPQAAPYGYRSFDRRWIVSDNRVMRTPSQGLWAHYSDDQIYLVSMLTYVIGAGPAASVSALIPDYHFFANRGGKDVVPFLRDATGTPNVTQGLLDALAGSLGDVHPDALFAYATAILSHPGYTERFWDALETPGPRVPITADRALFNDVVDVGRRVLAIQTFGTRGDGGLAQGVARIEKPIGTSMPTEFSYDPTTKTVTLGEGAVANVDPALWQFSISGFEVVRSWLRGRLLHPTGRASSSKSPLDAIRPTHWTADLDDEFLEMLWAIEATLALYEKQAALLERVMEGKLLDASGLPTPTEAERIPAPLSGEQGQLFEEGDEAQDDEGA
jgi:hypothetical protein